LKPREDKSKEKKFERRGEKRKKKKVVSISREPDGPNSIGGRSQNKEGKKDRYFKSRAKAHPSRQRKYGVK